MRLAASAPLQVFWRFRLSDPTLLHYSLDFDKTLQAARRHIQRERPWCGLNKVIQAPASTGSTLLWAGTFCLLGSCVVLSCRPRTLNSRYHSAWWCTDEAPWKTDRCLEKLPGESMLSDRLLHLEEPGFQGRPQAGDRCCCPALRAELHVLHWKKCIPPRAHGPRASHMVGQPLLAVLGQIDIRFEGAPGWGVEEQVALTSRWSPGFDWLSKSPRGGKNTELTQARVQVGSRGAASTDVFAVGLRQCCPLHTTPPP